MLEKMPGILLFLWLLGLILSFVSSGSAHILLVLTSMLFLITAGILVQIVKRTAIKSQQKKVNK